jgi:flagellar protein FlaI
MKYGQTYVRRIQSIYEVTGFDRDKNIPTVNKIYKWNPVSDKYEKDNESAVLQKISVQFGIPKQFLKKEIDNRVKILNWMTENRIDDYIDVSKIIKLYYVRAQDLLDEVG